MGKGYYDVKQYMERFGMGDKFLPVGKRYFEDFEVGEKFVTPAKFISETEVDLFCLLTGNNIAIHVDAEYSKSLGFKGKVVPGVYLVCAVFLLSGSIGLSEHGILFLSLNNVFFRAPVCVGDSIRLEFEIKEKKDVAKWKEHSIIALKWIIRNQDNVVVCEGESSHQWRRRVPLS